MSRHSMIDFPLYFDSTVMPQPHAWTETSNVVETVNKTEAGTDQVDVVRLDKLTISVEYGCADDLARTLKAFSKQNSIVVKYYDIETDDYKQRTMRMRKFSAALSQHSNELLAVRGVWRVSFDLEEF